MAWHGNGDKPVAQPKLIMASILLKLRNGDIWYIKIRNVLDYFCCRGPCPHTLQWRLNELEDVSNQQPHDRLLNHLFMRRSKKTSKLRVTGLCGENTPVTDEFPAQRAATRKMFPFDDVIMKFEITNGNIIVLTQEELPMTLYRKVSNISRTLVGNKIVDHSYVVGAPPVGAAPTTSSFST